MSHLQLRAESGEGYILIYFYWWIETINKYKVTACVHVGSMVGDRQSVTHPEEYIDVNIRGTATLLDALGKWV